MSVWANVFAVLTVSVRVDFPFPISKYPRFGSYRTFPSERTGKTTSGFACFSIRPSMPWATSTIALVVILSSFAFSACGDFVTGPPPRATRATEG